MANSRDFTGKNRKFTGTKGIVLPKGTTAERVGSESAELRYNTSTDLMEYFDGVTWKPIDAPPTISNISTNDTTGTTTIFNADGSTLYTITINGGNFSTGVTVKFIGNTGTEYSASNVTRVSASQITCKTVSNMGTTDDPYDVKVLNTSGLSATLDDAFSYNAAPVFVNAAGSIGNVWNGRVVSGSTFNASATDAEGNTITYTRVSGNFPGSGLTLSSSTGMITGTLSGSPTLGSYPFTIRASTTEGFVERQFHLQVIDPPFLAATGGTVLTVGDFKTHVFTSPGTFTVTNAGGPAGSNTVEYIVVAGGGGGGGDNAGGGGAGGYRTNFPSPATGGFPVTATGYPVTVGAGGPANPAVGYGIAGSPSSFSSITSTGGGGGGTCNTASPQMPGGSGSGGSQHGISGGTGNSPPVSPPQGNPGHPGSPNPGGGGGGGGAGQAGLAYSGEAGGKGGDGAGVPASVVFGPSSPSYGTPGPSPTLRYFAGGGGGGCGQLNNSQGGAGGAGGGGRGGGDTPGAGSSSAGDNGTTNTGGGGGGTGQCPQVPTAGGSGIVIIRYQFQ